MSAILTMNIIFKIYVLYLPKHSEKPHLGEEEEKLPSSL